MGDRYFFTAICPYCGCVDNNYYYAPTCNINNFHCSECGKTSFVDYEMHLKKAEEITPEELTKIFILNLNIWNPNEHEKDNILNDMKESIDRARNKNKILSIDK